MMTKEVLPNILKKKRRKRALWYDTEGLYIYFFTKTLKVLKLTNRGSLTIPSPLAFS
jgi:hypothetical protein